MRSAKDWGVFMILLLAGCFYLFLQVISILQNGYSIIRTNDDNITVNRSEILYEIRTWLTIILCLVGSITYFRLKKTGWVMAFAILLLFISISAGAIYTLVNLEMIDLSAYFLGLISILILFGFISLITPSTRSKFDIKPKDFLYAIVVTVILLGIYFI
jgi:hypothetical protein